MILLAQNRDPKAELHCTGKQGIHKTIQYTNRQHTGQEHSKQQGTRPNTGYASMMKKDGSRKANYGRSLLINFT